MKEVFPNKSVSIRLPMACAHMGGRAAARENSVEAVRISAASGVEGIEIDVRKSKDGILYCHHGSSLWHILKARFLRRLSFEEIRRIAGPMDTLEDIAAIVPNSKQLYLDVKEPEISPEDLRRALRGCRAKQFWIMAYRRRHLRRLMELGERNVYVYDALPWASLSPFRASGRYPDLIVNILVDFFLHRLPQGPAIFLSPYLLRWRIFDPVRRHYYVFRGNMWLSYDDPRLCPPKQPNEN